jgi:hypothetical protein
MTPTQDRAAATAQYGPLPCIRDRRPRAPQPNAFPSYLARDHHVKGLLVRLVKIPAGARPGRLGRLPTALGPDCGRTALSSPAPMGPIPALLLTAPALVLPAPPRRALLNRPFGHTGRRLFRAVAHSGPCQTDSGRRALRLAPLAWIIIARKALRFEAGLLFSTVLLCSTRSPKSHRAAAAEARQAQKSKDRGHCCLP